METSIIKVVNTGEELTIAIAELQGAGYSISYQNSSNLTAIDATKVGGDETIYNDTCIVIGVK